MKLSISRSWIQRVGLLLAILLYLHTEISEPLLFMLQVPISLGLSLLYVILWGFGSGEVSHVLRHYLGPALVASLLSVPLMIPIWIWQNAITERRANTIIQQVYAYQNQHGRYPDSLSQLVPQYLTSISSTAEGLFLPPAFQYRTFEYQPDSAKSQILQHFSLQYYPGAMVEASYGSRSRRWHYDD